MRTLALAPALALALALALACSSSERKEPVAPPAPIQTPPPPVETPAPAPVVLAAVGDACETETMFGQGTCAEGQNCVPFPGGYCTQACAFEDCPSGSVCTESPRAGDACLVTCSSDDDCRAQQGYLCDPDWKACVVPGFLTPKPPSCPSIAAPAKKSWSPAVQISTPAGPGKYHFEPAAGLTPDGSIAALYITNGIRTTATKSPFPNVLATSVVKADGSVVADMPLASSSENHFDPWIARDRSGLLHAVWLGFDGGMAPEKNMRIGYATTRDGITWSEPRAAHRPEDCPNAAPGCFDKPMIAIGPRHDKRRQDAIYVFYFSGARGGLVVTRSIDGGETFAASVLIDEAAYADAEVDSKGHVHVVYAASRSRQLSSPDGQVRYRSSADGGATFTEPVEVSATDQSIPFYFSNPQVIPDPRRKRVSVVYPAGDASGKWDIFLATTTDEGKTWRRTVVNDDESCASHMIPTGVLEPRTGDVHLAWAENRGGVGRIVAAVCNPRKLGCAANEQVSDADFAAYSFVRHGPRWLGEYFSVIPDPAGKKLHAVWTQPVDEDGRAVARIFYAARPLATR